jgi:hypothetical protein
MSCMLLIDRCDGKRVRELSSFGAIMPYVMRRRNEAAVYFSKDIDVENAVRYVRLGAADGREGPRPSLFGIAIAAAVRTIALKPRLNRFVHRRAVYQRNGISISFVVKKKVELDGSEAIAKIRFEPSDNLSESMARIEEGIGRARAGIPSADDREMALVHSIPFGKAIATTWFRFLDRFNIAPPSMVRNDPLFTSAYFANLGSIGLDTPFHHLYEWGTSSLFVVMGRMFEREVAKPEGGGGARHFVNFKITVDERIAEGAYYAHAASLFQRLLANPELLEKRPDLSTAEP